jgi:hypothetical protein
MAALVEATFRQCMNVAARDRHNGPGQDPEASRFGKSDRPIGRSDFDLDIDVDRVAIVCHPTQDGSLVLGQFGHAAAQRD